ncbi:MAG: hypothetical protein H0X64_10920 [Gemmatimonadaceae bacterium]|nr:hypothetical protein [Gemmatimonadaceae bacterium]
MSELRSGEGGRGSGEDRSGAGGRESGKATPETAAAGLAHRLDSETLISYVQGRRWFGAKGGAPTAARIAHALQLPWAGGVFAILRLDIDTTAGTLQYQLPVAARAAAPAGATTIAQVGDHAVYDATEDPEFRRELAAAFAGGCTVEYDGGRWVVARAGDRRLTLPPGADVTLGSAEQSNTSMRLGTSAILKLFRKLEAGEHPDVEVTEFLTLRQGFPNTPVLLGTIRWEDASGTTVGGMLQELVAGATGAWEYTLTTGRAYFDASRDSTPENAFEADAAQLGRVTRTMHDALARDDSSPSFAPEAAEEEELQDWAQRAEQQIEAAIDLLERQLAAGRIRRDRVEEAKVVVRRREHYIDLIEEIVEHVDEDAGQCIRHHGDYHLGQVLRTAAGEFMIIDFEGEPARPLAERRRKHSPLRDVAGMLRSFSYAAATLAGDARNGSGGTDPGTVEVRTGRWERDARDAFLAGYFGNAAAGYLPQEPANARRLLALFEIEKVFYELAYELNNRPEWIGIPLRGIARLTTGEMSRER